jgi:hypothetical protein
MPGSYIAAGTMSAAKIIATMYQGYCSHAGRPNPFWRSPTISVIDVLALEGRPPPMIRFVQKTAPIGE